MSAGRVRAFAALRARRSSVVTQLVGLVLAGAMLGTAVTTGEALANGFDRAQRAAGSPDLVVRFDALDRATIERRIGTLANIRSVAYRLTVRPVPIGIGATGKGVRRGTAEIDGVQQGHGRDGLAIVAGRALSGAGDEVVVERGLADSWKLRVGRQLGVLTRNGDLWKPVIVGVAVEPDNVAFPLAARPRIYADYDVVRDRFAERTSAEPVNLLAVRVRNRGRLSETLVQARQSSYGLSGLGFTTQATTRAIVAQASGLVVALLTAFAFVALVAVCAMLAASANARVARELPTIGMLRSLGFTTRGLAASYALETSLIALPALALGVTAGTLLVSGPTARLLAGLNELPPSHPLGILHVLVVLVATVLAGAAAALPASAAARRPVVELLAGVRVARRARAGGAVARPFALGARLVLGRPGRLVVSALAIGCSLALILLMLGLARFLLDAERNPSVIGERYSLLATEPPGGIPVVRGVAGVAAAAERYEVSAADAFNLSEPLQLVAFGPGKSSVFAGRPLLEGRRARSEGEVEVGRGMAQSLGLGVGSTLIADLSGGGEVRAEVVGVVQELARDGRVAYLSPQDLLAVQPGLRPRVAIRLRDGASRAAVKAELRSLGAPASDNGGLAPQGAPFLAAVVALLRVVAIIDGLVCGALVVLALIVLARERARTLGVMRAVGGRTRDVALVLAGGATTLVAVSLVVGVLLEREVLAPALSRLVERYGVLPLQARPGEIALVALACAAVVALAAVVLARPRTTVSEQLAQ